MSHVDDGKLNALLDGELDAAETEAVRTHMAACAECARRLEEAKQFLAGAADLLGALDLPAAVSAPAPPVRRVSKTAKEVAIDLDGATHKSPAIRPNLPEPAPAARYRFDFTNLSWAAMIVLALGVGYLANEVRHVRPGPQAGEGAVIRDQGGAVPVASPPAQPGTRSVSATAPKRGALERSATASRARTTPGTAPVAAKSAAPEAGKSLVTAPPARRAPAAAHAPSDLAAGAAPRAGAIAPAGRVGAQAPTPAPAAPAAANRPAAVAEIAVTDVAAPSEAAPAFRRVTLEEAVARLNGVIRLMDGMRFVRVELGPGQLVPGADRGLQLVRLVYYDAEDRRLVLDQQRITLPADGGVVSPDIGMREGDTLTTATPQGEVRVRWISGSFWLSLTGNLPPDELRRLTERVR